MSLPDDLCERIHAGETPLKVWREFRGIEVTDLRRETGIGVGRLEKLETGTGRKMTEDEERLLARVLDVSRVELRPMNFADCSDLDGLDEETILRESGDQ